MPLNSWWDGDRDQRYWMEVATTGTLGEILIAPKFEGAHWSYELVGQVRPGDRVLHWQSAGGVRGLVGWSVATAEPEVAPEYTWQPRGTAGRALPGPRTTEGWMVTLGGLNEFEHILSADALQGLRERVLETAAALEAEHGKPTYFPFYLYGGRELRAQQGYLVKFPSELFGVLPQLAAARETGRVDDIDLADDELPEDGERSRRPVPRGRVTRVQDPRLRSAIENHAVDRAIEHFVAMGGADFIKLGRPYDVRFLMAGLEHHVEVKGSSLLIETVELTRNEVDHARDFQPTHLVVVDDIAWERGDDGHVATAGGRVRVWSEWSPLDEDLTARKYAYALPAGP